jgi:hypothetical protein
LKVGARCCALREYVTFRPRRHSDVLSFEPCPAEARSPSRLWNDKTPPRRPGCPIRQSPRVGEAPNPLWKRLAHSMCGKRDHGQLSYEIGPGRRTLQMDEGGGKRRAVMAAVSQHEIIKGCRSYDPDEKAKKGNDHRFVYGSPPLRRHPQSSSASRFTAGAFGCGKHRPSSLRPPAPAISR